MSDFRSHLESARQELLTAQKRLNAEIAAYPSPISGCDAQFNYLLGERQKIGHALAALDNEFFVPTSRQPMSADELATHGLARP